MLNFFYNSIDNITGFEKSIKTKCVQFGYNHGQILPENAG